MKKVQIILSLCALFVASSNYGMLGRTSQLAPTTRRLFSTSAPMYGRRALAPKPSLLQKAQSLPWSQTARGMMVGGSLPGTYALVKKYKDDQARAEYEDQLRREREKHDALAQGWKDYAAERDLAQRRREDEELLTKWHQELEQEKQAQNWRWYNPGSWW